MKKTTAIIPAYMLTFALSTCSGSDYVMHANDGRTIVSDGKPQADNDTGMISYKDASGDRRQINRTDVKEMVELDQQFAIVRQKKTPQLGGATLIAMDEQGKCIGSEEGQLCYHGLGRRPITNTTTQHHSRKPEVHQNTHSDKTFRSGPESAATIGICWQKLNGQFIMAQIKKANKLHSVI